MHLSYDPSYKDHASICFSGHWPTLACWGLQDPNVTWPRQGAAHEGCGVPVLSPSAPAHPCNDGGPTGQGTRLRLQGLQPPQASRVQAGGPGEALGLRELALSWSPL